jgi:hypothetical protein
MRRWSIQERLYCAARRGAYSAPMSSSKAIKPTTATTATLQAAHLPTFELDGRNELKHPAARISRKEFPILRQTREKRGHQKDQQWEDFQSSSPIA